MAKAPSDKLKLSVDDMLSGKLSLARKLQILVFADDPNVRGSLWSNCCTWASREWFENLTEHGFLKLEANPEEHWFGSYAGAVVHHITNKGRQFLKKHGCDRKSLLFAERAQIDAELATLR